MMIDFALLYLARILFCFFFLVRRRQGTRLVKEKATDQLSSLDDEDIQRVLLQFHKRVLAAS